MYGNHAVTNMAQEPLPQRACNILYLTDISIFWVPVSMQFLQYAQMEKRDWEFLNNINAFYLLPIWPRPSTNIFTQRVMNFYNFSRAFLANIATYLVCLVYAHAGVF